MIRRHLSSTSFSLFSFLPVSLFSVVSCLTCDEPHLIYYLYSSPALLAPSVPARSGVVLVCHGGEGDGVWHSSISVRRGSVAQVDGSISVLHGRLTCWGVVGFRRSRRRESSRGRRRSFPSAFFFVFRLSSGYLLLKWLRRTYNFYRLYG